MRIGITGVPGTGKTETAKVLGKLLNYEVVHQADLFSGTVSLKAVRTKFWWLLERKNNVIVEGHLLCDVKLPLDILFILRTQPDILLSRLEMKGYDKRKIDENVLAEALDYCIQRAEGRYKNIIQLDTTHSTPEETAKRMIECLEGGCEGDEVDWIPVLEKLIIGGRITYL